jgi:hypothetical protein
MFEIITFRYNQSLQEHLQLYSRHTRCALERGLHFEASPAPVSNIKLLRKFPRRVSMPQGWSMDFPSQDVVAVDVARLLCASSSVLKHKSETIRTAGNSWGCSAELLGLRFVKEDALFVLISLLLLYHPIAPSFGENVRGRGGEHHYNQARMPLTGQHAC